MISSSHPHTCATVASPASTSLTACMYLYGCKVGMEKEGSPSLCTNSHTSVHCTASVVANRCRDSSPTWSRIGHCGLWIVDWIVDCG